MGRTVSITDRLIVRRKTGIELRHSDTMAAQAPTTEPRLQLSRNEGCSQQLAETMNVFKYILKFKQTSETTVNRTV